METSEDKNQEFLNRLKQATSQASEEMEFDGICPACFGTNKEFQKEGEYWGVVARREGQSLTFSICTHGEDVTEGFNF